MFSTARNGVNLLDTMIYDKNILVGRDTQTDGWVER